MLWKVLVGICSFLVGSFRGTVDSEIPFEATPHGPQSWEEAEQAAHALYGNGDDIIWPDRHGRSHAAIKGDDYKWPNKTIVYVLSPEVSKDATLKTLIEDSIKYIEEETCIKFVKRTNEKYYVNVKKDSNKCYSAVGCLRRPGQPLSLGKGCAYKGTAIHEWGHAMGLYHEHQRSDRDDYITVNFKNVLPGSKHNFDKTAPEKEDMLGFGYDCDSMMHYGNYAFSRNRGGGLKTMEAKDGTVLKDPFEKDKLTQLDIDLIKKLYDC